MSLRQCAVCKRMVREGDEIEHLRTNHLGPHYFFYEAREYCTEEPSMTVAEIYRRCRGEVPGIGQMFEDRDGERVYYAHSEAVDLTRRPHLFHDIPATPISIRP